MEVFMKDKFKAYETLTQATIRIDETTSDILTLKITGISNGKNKQIQINFTKKDSMQFAWLQEFIDEADNFGWVKV